MTEDHDGWPRLTPDLLSALPEHEQLLIRQHEDELIAGSKMQLADICDNCHIRPQFAKTYRVLRRDLRDTLQKMRAGLIQPHPVLSDTCGGALLRSTDAIISYKLQLMDQHFYLRWGEPIENWAGKEGSAVDRAGCYVVTATYGDCSHQAMLVRARCRRRFLLNPLLTIGWCVYKYYGPILARWSRSNRIAFWGCKVLVADPIVRATGNSLLVSALCMVYLTMLSLFGLSLLLPCIFLRLVIRAFAGAAPNQPLQPTEAVIAASRTIQPLQGGLGDCALASPP